MSTQPFEAPPEPAGRSFVVRTLLLPFHPGAWRDTAAAGWMSVVTSLVLVAFALATPITVWRTGWMLSEFRDAAGAYDASFDPVVIDGGVVRVDGPRLPRAVDERRTFVVDPDETVAEASITTPEYVIVRRDVIIRQRAFGPAQVTRVADVVEMFGLEEPVIVDSAHLRALVDTWGLAITVGFAAVMLPFIVVVDVLAALFHGAIGGFAAATVTGRPPGRVIAVAATAAAATWLPHHGLVALGSSPGPCLGLFVWPTVLGILALFATRE